MNVLVVGSGGREHALAWKAAQSAQVEKVFVAPGNAGTALEAKLENVNINVNDVQGLIEFAQNNAVELTIIGPEAPLVIGIVDEFQQAGLKCFGPSLQAAQLEGSKTFTKDFLIRHNIPTAAYGTFTDVQTALDYLHNTFTDKQRIVIKADGLAAGKGVVITDDMQEAEDTIKDMLEGNIFGEAGQRVVIEEFLEGEEASFICIVDGEHIQAFASSQDHKPRDEGDKGPNTGGMGAYSPAPVVTQDIHDRVMKEVIEPTVKGMAAEGYPYTGFLYAGLMIDSQGTPKVLEYNCRFGDPETQPIMLRLKSDLVEVCLAAVEKRLDQVTLEWDERTSLGVVLAAGGYPTSYAKGHVIQGLLEADGMDGKVFHAGTNRRDGEIVTDGGRVLCVTALGHSVSEAQNKAYNIISKISWTNMYYRKDIGYRAIAREKEST
ncbi:phosphoribosylamine--glycine ligase [Candidatus Albibeggiatoa sp. nov. NOAA]|uniref:phosphoribosylamine--glycine ligase n=1 Tax=Candidatus Albibeggiatoa sp. nov. NOAA TaxID=3162724 RepID=UPI0032FC9FFD|nr:phosphoribosylamine--glycine ligase [Thiotrichaceae bacterium]